MNYALTAIKTARGEETPCFSAHVTLDNKLVGSVRNSGTGGCCQWNWSTTADGHAFFNWIGPSTAASAEPDDAWAYAQLDKFEETKTYMRKSLKKALFRLEGDGADTYRELNCTDLVKVKAYLLAKYAALKPMIFDRTVKNWIAA